MKLSKITCEEFAAKLASKEPVPGGGGVAALVGALGAALGSMVGNYSIGKKKFLGMEAKHQEIIDKKPSADLWIGQTDEEELGFSYSDADNVLYELLDKKKGRTQIIEMGFTSEVVDSIIEKIKNSEFKRRMPKIAFIRDRV